MKANLKRMKILSIASPCAADWQSMTGDGRTRLCHLCSLTVYNVAGMSMSEVEQLLIETEYSQQKLCMRLYRRPDGTILTDECPRMLRRVRDHAITFKTVVALLSGWISSLVVTSARAEQLESPRLIDSNLHFGNAEQPRPQRAQKHPLFEMPKPNVPLNADKNERKQIVMGAVSIDYRATLLAMQKKIQSGCSADVAHSKCSVAFNLRKDGSIFNLKVVRSSGDLAIDEKATKLIDNAAPFAPLPVGSEDVEVEFRFDEKMEKSR